MRMKMAGVRVYGTHVEMGLINSYTLKMKLRFISGSIKMDIIDANFGRQIGFNWLRLG
jgi:hypothetical protein